MNILLVEDDPVSMNLLRADITSLGHELRTAENGAQALEVFDPHTTQVIIADWSMPVMDGLELCRKVRERSKRAYIYIIILTATYKSKENFYEAMEAEADDFLTKPYDKADLVVRLRVAERLLNYCSQVHQLKSLLPICVYCKKIRNDQDYWQEIESYIKTQTGSDFTHGICPTCYETRVKPEIESEDER